MMSFTETKTLRTGAIGLVATVLAVVGSLQFDRLPLISADVTYSAYFADSTGLKTGDKVVVAGVPVGEVRTLAVVDSNKVKVEFTAAGVTIGDESRISIDNRTVLGSRQLEIESKGERLGAGKTLGLDHTSTPYVLTDTLGQLTTAISGIKTDSLNTSLDELGKTLTTVQPDLNGTLKGVERLSQTINTRDTKVQELFKSAAAVSGVLNERSQQINTIILSGNTLLQSLVERRQAVDDLLENIRSVSQQLSGFVADNRAQIGPALDNLNEVIELLNKHRDDITNSIKPLQQYAQSLGESVASGPFFKAYVSNLLPGQFLQPFIDAALGDYQSKNPVPALPQLKQGEPGGQPGSPNYQKNPQGEPGGPPKGNP